jgi:phospholipid/cholesterol/gamma-HCH transport system permease protein
MARATLGPPRALANFLGQAGGMSPLFGRTLYWVFLGPFRERTEQRRHVFPLMEAIGNKPFPIVALVALLIGIILVLQTGYLLEKYGQIRQVSGLVAVSMTRELGPLMTAIVLVGRVGAAFTSGLGTMTISEEILALRTMSTDPVGYLVAPRFIAIVVMLPGLTVFTNVVGIAGGCLMATTYDLDSWAYVNDSLDLLALQDLLSGVVTSVLFAVVNGITFSVERGTNFVILGASGGGKSTLLKIMIAALKADEGEGRIDGVDLTRAHERELRAVRDARAPPANALRNAEALSEKLSARPDDLTGRFGRAAEVLERLLRDADGLVVENHKNVYETIRALRDAAYPMEQASKRIRANPSILLFGAEETPEERRRADETTKR